PRRGAELGGGARRRRAVRGLPGLQLPKSSAKRIGRSCGCSPGASGGRRRRADGSPAGFGGGIGAVAVTGWCGGGPRLLTRREDTSGPCEGGTGVKEALRSTAAGNC